MGILILGVVLLTHKKPDNQSKNANGPPLKSISSSKARGAKDGQSALDNEDDEDVILREGNEEQQVLWEVGEMSDDDDDAGPRYTQGRNDAKARFATREEIV